LRRLSAGVALVVIAVPSPTLAQDRPTSFGPNSPAISNHGTLNLQYIQIQNCPDGQALKSITFGNKTSKRCCPSEQYPSGATCCPQDMAETNGRCSPLDQAALCENGQIKFCAAAANAAYEAHEDDRAFKYASKACDTPHRDVADAAPGCFTLGRMYLEGRGTQKDTQAAERALDTSCDVGNPDACQALANIQEESTVKTEREHAAELWKKACLLSSREACHNFGVSIVNRQGFDKASTEFFDLACASGTGIALSCYYSGLARVGTSGNMDRETVEYFQWACHDKVTESCYRLALAYDWGEGTDRNPLRAANLYDEACAAGHGPSCYAIGISYETGYAVNRNYQLGARMLLRATELKSALGFEGVGVALSRGDGWDESVSLAKGYLFFACKDGLDGLEGACFRLGMLQVRERESWGPQTVGAACTAGSDEACEFVEKFRPKRPSFGTRTSADVFPLGGAWLSQSSAHTGALGGFGVSYYWRVLSLSVAVGFSTSQTYISNGVLDLSFAPISWPNANQSTWVLLNPSVGPALFLNSDHGSKDTEAGFGASVRNRFIFGCWFSATLEYGQSLLGPFGTDQFLAVGLGIHLAAVNVFQSDAPYVDRCGRLRLPY
jgi:uncharacterized protein